MLTISVITVTYNNADGLRKTLQSLAGLRKKPEEVIVVDGGSADATKEVIREYEKVLHIIFVSEKDDGIYDAMNKGLRLAKCDAVHYLNAGDYVEGEPYQDAYKNSRLPVSIVDEKGRHLSFDKVSLWGSGYCHQGFIFSNHHPQYDTQYKIASDLDLIIQLFPRGLKELPLSHTGSVVYNLCGESSNRRFPRDLEVARILYRRRGVLLSLVFVTHALVKAALPKFVRRYLRKYV